MADALKNASNGQITATVEESQGSVQNVKEAGRRSGNFLFTTPPNLLADARTGKKISPDYANWTTHPNNPMSDHR